MEPFKCTGEPRPPTKQSIESIALIHPERVLRRRESEVSSVRQAGTACSSSWRHPFRSSAECLAGPPRAARASAAADWEKGSGSRRSLNTSRHARAGRRPHQPRLRPNFRRVIRESAGLKRDWFDASSRNHGTVRFQRLSRSRCCATRPSSSATGFGSSDAPSRGSTPGGEHAALQR